MCEDMRAEIRRLVKELCISQAEVARQITAQGNYTVNSSELSSAMNGLNTPKSRRILTDALSFLTEQKMRQKSLIDLAKRS